MHVRLVLRPLRKYQVIWLPAHPLHAVGHALKECFLQDHIFRSDILVLRLPPEFRLGHHIDAALFKIDIRVLGVGRFFVSETGLKEKH